MSRWVMMTVMLVALAVPATAAADDAEIRWAVCSNDAGFRDLGERSRREARRWERRDFRRPGRLLRLLAKVRDLLAETRAAVEPVQPSSERGAEGKALYLRSFTQFDRSLRLERRAVRRSARLGRRATRLYRRTAREYRRSVRTSRRARAIFIELGITDEESGCLS